MQSSEPEKAVAHEKRVSALLRGVMILGVASVIVVVAIVEGNRSNRWGATADLTIATKKLEGVPQEFGDWVSSERPLSEKIFKVTEATGTVSRVYYNQKSGDTITVLLLCGPSGPIGAHTPEVCYGGMGYSCRGNPTRKGLAVRNAGTSTFWTARFEKTTPTDEPLRVYWSWGINGDWEAAANPRTTFALTDALYKLYVVCSDNPALKPVDSQRDPVEKFLAEFLPLVKTALQPLSD